jgi:hypothetical protein
VHTHRLLAGAAAAAVVALSPAAAAGPPPAPSPTAACPAGTWIRSETAAWLRRVVQVAGYRISGCTGSAWIAATPRTTFYVWSTERWRPSGELHRYRKTPLPTYTDGTRLVWAAQGLGIWVEPGPTSQALPGRTALGWLQISSRALPRRYRPIAMMATPPAVFARCRSDRNLRPACPARIPRIPGWETYPRVVDGLFGIQRGGEIPGRPELMRPPHVLHVEVAVTPDRRVPFPWPETAPVSPRDGLMRVGRRKPLLLGPATWNGKRGSVALAPGFPLGGSQGNHVLFRWNAGGRTYVVGLHGWEPFNEAYATLRRVVASLPR